MASAGRAIASLSAEYSLEVDARSGAAELSVPVPLTPGRHGLTPTLGLIYGNGQGNSAVGAGWALVGLPAIGIETRKRVPSWDGTDPVQLGSDELVPWLAPGGGSWAPRGQIEGDFTVAYYRSRRGGARTRVEKWVHRTTGRVHFRTRDDSNTLTIYGARADGTSRIADPDAPERTFTWLPELVVDTHGNAVWLEYVAEDLRGVDRSAPFEPARPCLTQRYLKRARYGNASPLAINADVLAGVRPPGLRWLFQVVLDYGDHADHGAAAVPVADPDQPWPARLDAFTSARAGFEVRTYRLCRRFLCFHDIPELGSGPTLVGALVLAHEHQASGAVLRSIQRHGYRRDNGTINSRAIPPLQLTYAPAVTGTGFEAAPATAAANVPGGLGGPVTLVDLHGEGLAGILTETDHAWYYKRNLGGGRFADQVALAERPATSTGSHALGDVDADGDTDLALAAGRMAGRFTLDREDARWSGFRAFDAFPHVEALGGRAQWVDLNGDGRPDVVIARDDSLVWFASDGDEFAPPVEVPRPDRSDAPILGAEPDLDVFFADMNGDGLPDLVRIQNGRVEYWPGLGNGRFGAGVVMDGAPHFAAAGELDGSRFRFLDLDGSGTSDLVYLGNGEVTCWINAAGNALLAGPRLAGLPHLDNQATLAVLDLLGDGRPCLVWSTGLPGRDHPIEYLPLAPAVRPRLLTAIDNSMGRETRLRYGSSAAHYLRDQASGRGWSTRLPGHHTVVDRREVIDHVGDTRSVTRWEYHDGFYDGADRESRGFGQVDVYDLDGSDGAPPGPGEPAFAAPALVRTWFHLGTAMWNHQRPFDTYDGDAALPAIPPHAVDGVGGLTPDEIEDGLRGLAGNTIRREIWAVDDHGRRSPVPIEVRQTGYRVTRVQPASGPRPPAFTSVIGEELAAVYEQVGGDPRVTHEVTLAVDAYDAPARTAAIAYPRRPGPPRDATDQDRQSVVIAEHRVVHVDQDQRFELGIPIESATYELVGLRPGAGGRLTRAALTAGPVAAALAAPGPQQVDLADDPLLGPRARLLSREQSFYWSSARTAALPLGQIGALALVHHEESACFTPALVADIYGARVDAVRLAALGYVLRDGLWWQVDPTHEFSPPAEFSQRLATERGDGGRATVRYDAHAVAAIEVTDAVGNRVAHQLDYHMLLPWRTTDPNGNVSEQRFDPLGVAIAASYQGHVDAAPWGFAPLAGWVERAAASAAAVIADPDRYLQDVARVLWYDLDAWRRDGTPAVVVSLARVDLRDDGAGRGAARGALQTAVVYLDALGRTLQDKVRIEGGEAIERDGQGRVVVDGGGRPLLASSVERWRASGHVVHDAKQRPGRRYQPFFTPTAAFEGDAVLRQFGVSATTRYDPVGRIVGEDLPNGTSSAVRFGPWEVEYADVNDTVMTSAYRALRETRPAGDPERQAWEHARDHAGTTRSVYLDPAGRACAQLGRGGATAADRRSESRHDVEGRVRERIDSRELVAFRYRSDMAGRVLVDHSLDAGDVVALHDAYDRVVTTWSPRGFEVEHGHDRADRPRFTHVRGGDGAAALDHRVEEWQYGDELVDAAEAARRNLLGQLVRVRDGAGEAEIDQADPGGKPLRSTRRLRTGLGDPDWRAAPPLGDAFTASVVYDAVGRPIGDRLPDGATRTYAYRASGALDRVLVTTPGGGLTELPVLDGTGHDARGAPTAVRLGNGIEVAYTYDYLTSRLATQTATTLAGRRLQAIGYTYDPTGSIVRIVDAAQEGPGAIVTGTTVPARRDYTYDAHRRLRTATGRVHQALLEHDYIPGAGGTVKGTRHLSLANGAALERFTRTYEYDRGGNLRSIQHAGASRTWNTEMWISAGSNRSLPRLSPAGVPVAAPESHFDAGGNLRELSHLRRLEWNWRNALVRAVVIERAGGTDDAEQYAYGQDGIRVRKLATRVVHGGQIEEIEKVYLGDQERKRVHRDGRLVLERWTTHVSDGQRRIAMIHRWERDDLAREVASTATPRVHYQLTTHLGSSAVEVDQAGGVISYEEYFPYGGTALIASPAARDVESKDYRYSGKERDDATSLYYYGHRYLAPWMGRWLSPDPVGPRDDLNLYQFVLGDPVANVDATGLDTSVPGGPQPGEIKYVNRAPPKPAATVDGQVTAYRDSLSKRTRSGFDTLSPADQRRVVTEPGFLVPKDPRSKGNVPWAYISERDYHDKWLPARQKWAKAQGTYLVVTIPSLNPNRVPATGGGGQGTSTDGTTTKPKGDPGGGGGATTKPGDGGGGTGGKKGDKCDGSNGGKGDSNGDGEDKAKGDGRGGGDGKGNAEKAHEKLHKDAGNGGGRGRGSGKLEGIGTEPSEYDGGFGGQNGGAPDGIVGGTPWARGTTPGGEGTSLDPRAPLRGGGSGSYGGGDSTPTSSGGGGGQSSQAGNGGARKTTGSSAGNSEATGPSSGSDAARGQGPGGAKQQGAGSGSGSPQGSRKGQEGGSGKYGWKNVALEISAILNFTSPDGDPNGKEGGIPGGMGLLGLQGDFVQWLYVGLSVVNFIAMLTGIGEMVQGLFALLRGLGRLGWKLFTQLPKLLRFGWRGILKALSALRPANLRLGLTYLRTVLTGARTYLTSRAWSSGFKHSRKAIIEAFRNAKHTTVSREVLEAIESGKLKVQFKALDGGGATGSAGKIIVNNTMHIEDVLQTIVHEGQHALDLAKGRIPLPGAATAAQVAEAELRAFTSALNFIEANSFKAAKLADSVGVSPYLVLDAIITKYQLGGKTLETLLSFDDLFLILQSFSK